MNIEELKKQIIVANKAYRNGHPTMDDQMFDDLCEELEKNISFDEYSAFRDSLNESIIEDGEKIKHNYVMGSLDKIKNSDVTALDKFIKSYVHNKLNVSAKVDGISSVAKYVNGKLVSFASRGDGYEGTSFIDKAPFIKNLPKKINLNEEIFIRGELVICEDECIESATNLRNICAGWMNSKMWKNEDISKISFIPYTILGDKYTKDEQFDLMKSLGFDIAWNVDIDQNQENLQDVLTNYAHMEHKYACDGLVLIDNKAYNEQNVYRPKNCFAYKINELTATTKIIDVAWEGPSKDGFIWPIFILDPVVLGGATISRASASNLDIIESLGARYGSVVEITKANDIIPHVDKVISNEHTSPIEYPTECPCCGGQLVKDGVNLRCKNENCEDQVINQLVLFIKNLGVKSASNATLKNFGITSFEKLVNFEPNKKYKSEVKLANELKDKMFSRSKLDLLCNMTCFGGLAETNLRKIIDFYASKGSKVEDFIFSCDPKGYALNTNMKALWTERYGLPVGIGEITLDKFQDGLEKAYNNVMLIVNNIKYHYQENSTSYLDESRNNSNGQSVCFTGALNTMSRAEASKKAQEAGFEIKSGVSRGLTYLVTNNIDSGSSKARKAKELGTKVITENEFLKLISKNTIEEDIANL